MEEKKQEIIQEVKPERKKVNLWKVAFLLLITIIIGGFVFLFILITVDKKSDVTVTPPAVESGEPTFQIQLTKNQANQIINYYLDEFQAESPIKYNFVLEDQAILRGTYTFLGQDINFHLYFESKVLENGDIKLEAKKISLGKLSLPVSELMSILQRTFTLPSWVSVEPKNEVIILHLSQYELSNGMQIKAEEIDLKKDVIKIQVYLPLTASKK